MQSDELLDTCGLPCPLPLLKAKQALARLVEGQVLEIVATDAGSWRDFEVFAEHSTHVLLAREAHDGAYHYWLRKGGEPVT